MLTNLKSYDEYLFEDELGGFEEEIDETELDESELYEAGPRRSSFQKKEGAADSLVAKEIMADPQVKVLVEKLRHVAAKKAKMIAKQHGTVKYLKDFSIKIPIFKGGAVVTTE